MTRLLSPSPSAVLGLAWAGLATALCGLALGLLLLPQRLLQQPLHQGVVTLTWRPTTSCGSGISP